MDTTPTSNTPRRLAALVAACAALALAGCAGDDETADGERVASLGGDDEADDPAELPSDDDVEAPTDVDDAFALFSECMTDAGFDFEVATSGSAGASIEVEVGEDESDPQVDGSFADVDMEAFEIANDECSVHLENVDAGFDLDPEQQAAFEDAQLAWSECMEEQGIEIPEMTAAGGGGVVIIGEEVDDPQATGDGLADLDFERFEAAAEQCDHLFDEVRSEIEP